MHRSKYKGLRIIFAFLTIYLSSSFVSAQLLDPSTQIKFVNDLPVIRELGLRVDLTQGGNIDVQLVQTTQDLGLQGIPNYLDDGGSTVWAYKFPNLPPTYPGATIVAKKNIAIEIEWQNNLPVHFLPVDPTLHIAHPMSLNSVSEVRDWYAAGNTPAVTHVHGLHAESASDGLPEAWYTQNFNETGAHFVKQRYYYHNDQEAGTIWYHDHALGITRLNVYAGLAGFYLLRDDNEERMIKQNRIPNGEYEIELAIQDRMFDQNGELFWPAYPGDPAYHEFIIEEGAELPEEDFPGGGPTALAEFFGDFILVNGKAWPKLEVEPRKYRFRLLNGSDSRFYVLEFHDAQTGGTPQSFLQIGTDDAFLEKPVPMSSLLIAPGERMDVVFDFTGLNGQQLFLRNLGPDEPYGGGVPGIDFIPAEETTTGQIMRFDVVKPFNNAIANAKVKEQSRLNRPIKPLNPDGVTRQLVLFEGMDEYGRLMPMLGTLAQGSLTWSDAITENPMLNATEIWEVYNATGDAHPIHLHLVAFQILSRETFVGSVADKTHLAHNGEEINGGLLTVTSLLGDQRAAEPNEQGWKDTAVMLPGEVTRIIAHFDREGRYVWHCHILSHEDHEMMRPFYVGTMPAPKKGQDILATEFRLEQNYPNPFNPSTKISFSVPEKSHVMLKIYDILGREVATLLNQAIPKGSHEVQFDASVLTSGVYFYNLTAGDYFETKKMTLIK